MPLTRKLNGTLKMVPTPHHKTAYKSKSSEQSWLTRHKNLFTQLGQEMGFTVKELTDVNIMLEHEALGNFELVFSWSYENPNVRVLSLHNSQILYTFTQWRGSGKPRSHNDGQLGNQFIKIVRKNWVERTKPPLNLIEVGDEVVFSSDPSGAGQHTRAEVIGKGGEGGRKCLRVKTLEPRGVRKIRPAGTVWEIHYENIISVKKGKSPPQS